MESPPLGGRGKKDGSQKQASLKARGINDTLARPLASLIKRKETFLVLGEKGKKEAREREDEGRREMDREKRSGSAAEPRQWNLLLASGSILGGLLPRCWVAESGSRRLGGLFQCLLRALTAARLLTA